jgi:hypothetical protein
VSIDVAQDLKHVLDSAHSQTIGTAIRTGKAIEFIKLSTNHDFTQFHKISNQAISSWLLLTPTNKLHIWNQLGKLG